MVKKKAAEEKGEKSYINECSAPKTFHFAINFSSPTLLLLLLVRHSFFRLYRALCERSSAVGRIFIVKSAVALQIRKVDKENYNVIVCLLRKQGLGVV